jgi:hypothetical protein
MKTRSQEKKKKIPSIGVFEEYYTNLKNYEEKPKTETKDLMSKYITLYEVNIDFDAASEAWKSNKRSIGNGSYKYVCTKRYKNNNCCINKCLHGEDYCKKHILT